eukprot:m.30598 g.30598  ORF g.30598 m.30598 type:complete len:1351 (+) comp31366_c1_seq1:143-4195(+)
MASFPTIKERKARWKELEKLIVSYNKRHQRDAFRLSLPNKELIFKGIVRVFFQNNGGFTQSKCLQVDSQMSSAKIVAKVMGKLGLNQEDPSGYALYHVYAETKEERLIGDAECPLTFLIFYSEKDNAEARLALRKQPVLTTAQKRLSMTAQMRKSREWQCPKDEVVDYGICVIEASFEDETSLIGIQSNRVTEASKDLVNLVARNGKPRFGMPGREHLWKFLGPKAAQIIVNVKQLVINATETGNRHCSQQLCLKFVTLHIDAVTQAAKEVIFTAKSVAGLPGAVAMGRDEAIQKLIGEVENLCVLVKQCKAVVHNTIVTGHLALMLPDWLGEEPLQAETTLTGSSTVSSALVFTVVAAVIKLMEVTLDRDKNAFNDISGNIITSAQLAVETVQGSPDYSHLNRHPLKFRVADVHKLLQKAVSDLFRSVKLASGIWPPPGSITEMLLSSCGVLLAVVNYTVISQCASLFHALSLSAWDILRYPWVTALLENKGQEEGIEVAASLSTVTDMMSQTDVEDIVMSEVAVTNVTSGFVSADGDTPNMGTVLPGNADDSEGCDTNDAILTRRSSLGSILEEGEEEEAVNVSQPPEESQEKRSESRKSSTAAVAGSATVTVTDDVALPEGVNAGRRGSSSARKLSVSSDLSGKRKMSGGSLGMRRVDEEQGVIQEEQVGVNVNVTVLAPAQEVKAAVSPGLTVKQLRDTIEEVEADGKVVVPQVKKVSRTNPKMIVERVKSPMEGIDSSNVGKLKHCLAVNKAISKAVESLFFSINSKVTALEAALIKGETLRYQRLCKAICDAAKQISDEIGIMEVNFTSQDFQDVRDLMDRHHTPLMLAIKEATAMAVYESGAWSQANVSSSFFTAIQQVKDLSYQMVAAALKATSILNRLVNKLGKTQEEPASSSENHNSVSRSKSWFQSIFDEKEDLLFFDQSTVNDGYLTLRRSAGDLPLVKGGTPSQLMRRLTYHKVVDTDFTDDFLLTFHAFTTPNVLMNTLISRYNLRAPEGLTSDEQIQVYAEVMIPIRLRIVNVIRCWMNRQFNDFKDKDLVEKLESFLETVARSLPACAKQLKTQLKRSQLHGPEQPKPRPSARHQGRANILKTFAMDSSDPTPILAIDPSEVAKLLTVIEWDIFKKIQPRECVGLPWNYPECQHLAPNMLALINRASKFSRWVTGIIIRGDTAEKRASAMTYFTRTARKCYEIKNYQTLFTIITALTSAPIRRMGLTWEALPAKTRSLLGQLNRFTSEAENFTNYRQELHQVSQQPCVPYFGVIFSELSFVEEGNATLLPRHQGMINFHKYRLYGKAIRKIQQHQQVAYNLGMLKPVYEHLKDLDPVFDEKELLRRSAATEPDL